MLTGDFLMPYLLSTVDHGVGMMKMLNAVPIEFLTWGNHEHDLAHEHVMAREKEFLGTWINSNMQSHESFADSTSQVTFTSPQHCHHLPFFSLSLFRTCKALAQN
jgi:2',3'-cyclic-nucleotide 2'-phosphodiesterase (5'-nucleotidase family)